MTDINEIRYGTTRVEIQEANVDCFHQEMAMASHETIHSGHFMVSNVHDKCYDDDEEEIDVVSDNRLPGIEVTPDGKDEKPVTFYKFGPQTTRSIDIDTSLLKLNKCIQTAYAQLITPKWKFFRGLKLAWKERIRLNNVIWRAWHAQFVRNSQPKFCHFSVPEDDWHEGDEAAGLMEGIYWKRRMETVSAQYKRWRHFHVRRTSRPSCSGGPRMRSRSMRHSTSDEDALLLPLPSLTPLSGFDDDDWNNWFTDSLFASLGQPYLFPNPREMVQASNADFIQPSLVQLQPSLEEIMASLENDGPLAGYFDPSLNMVATPNQGMEKLEDPLSEDTSLESVADTSSHPYATAPMMAQYSTSMTGPNGASQTACSTTTYTGQPLPTQTYDMRTVGPCESEMYGQVAPRETNSEPGLCDPYVPQAATIETNTVQYTLAKTWLAETNGTGRTTMATAGGYEYPIEPGPPPNTAYSQMPATVQLLKSDPCVTLPMTATQTGAEFEMAGPAGQQSQPTLPKRNRQSSRRPSDKKMQRGACGDGPAAPADVMTSGHCPSSVNVFGRVGEDGPPSPPFAPPPPASQRRRGSGMVPPRSAGFDGTVTGGSAKRRASCTVAGSLGVATFDYSSFMGNEMRTPKQDEAQTYSSLQPLVLHQPQQQTVVRPIPISLTTRTDSAFSAISPTGFNSPQATQMSHSPGSSNSAMDTAVVSIGQQQFVYGGQNGQSASQSQSSTQAPVLILQSFGGMQIPIMALPYASSGASFPSASPKQESEKVPLSPYDPGAYACFGNDISMKQTGQQMPRSESFSIQRAGVKGQEGSVGHQPKKTAKRAADSTLDPFERKRVQHLHAEQSRRSALKSGFELLEDLLPEFNSTNTKPTNALVLLKSAERIRELKEALPSNDTAVLRLKTEIQQMNEKISTYQKQLTVSGKSVTKVGMFQQLLDGYVKQRIQRSWQFWLIKKVFEPLMETYKTEVQGSSREEVLQSAIQWARKRCTKEELRPVLNGFLVQLGVETPLLKDPSCFRQYVMEQLDK